MNVVVEEVSPCRKRLNIEIPKERVREEFDTLLAEYTRHATVKGFRQGKAPASVVQMRYGKQIKQDLRDRLVPEGYRTALEQEEINPVAVLEINDPHVDPKMPMAFSVLCDVAPQFNLPTYRNLVINSQSEPVGENDIDQGLASVLDQFATFEDTDRVVAKEDLVQVDYQATIDGQPLAEAVPDAGTLAAAEDFWVQVGEHAFLPEFAEGLVGVAPGDKTRIEVTFANDFSHSSLQGRSAVFDVHVKHVREKKIPDLDEERLKMLGVESEEMLRERIRDEIQAHRQSSDRTQLKNQIVSHLLQATIFELPESVLQEETRSTVYEMVQTIVRRGAQRETVEEQRDEIFDAASHSASEKVKIRYILSRISDEEEIFVTDAEVDQRIAALAARYQMPAAELSAELKSRGQSDSVAQDVRLEKALDFLLDEANIT